MRKKKMQITAGCVALALACLAPFGALQAQPAGGQDGVSFHYGIGDHYQRLNLNYETPTWWSMQFSNGGRLELNGELGASYWYADGSRSPSSVWQFNATPMFRWWTNDIFYLEAGIGATAFTSTHFADKQISTAFQFGDHIGLGFLLTPNNRVGVRYSHFSNANIKRPNPGLDIVQLTYTYQF